MHLVIIGATGRTGRQVAEQALARGHQVTAVVRNGSSFEATPGLRVVVADPYKADQLTPALTGQEAVISCLGQRQGGNSWLVRDAAEATLQAMARAGLERFVIVSGALLYPSRNPLVLLLKQVMAGRLRDGRAAENVVTASKANWTIVRPPRLLVGDGNEGYRIETGERPKLTWGLRFSDLAACLLDLSEGNTHPREIVGIAAG